MHDLLDVPGNATWPRFMTGPHPDAVGSIGPEFEAFVLKRMGSPLRWWQRLAARRILEVNAKGELCWLTWLLTMSRQSGKSLLMRELALWRLHQSVRFGEPQSVLHIANVLRVGDSVQREARLWAKEQPGWKAKAGNGTQELEAPDGSIWRLLAGGGVYGYSGCLCFVDEAWKIPGAVVDDGLLPTLMERAQPQLGIISTAHHLATGLFVDARLGALGGDGSLLMEWSAGPELQFDSPEAWRAASPHWSPTREKIVRQALAKVLAGSPSGDGVDSLPSFEAQYLNRWPVLMNRAVAELGAPLLVPGLWAELEAELDPEGPLTFALDDVGGEAVVLAIAGRSGGLSVVEAYRLVGDRRPAYEWVRTQSEVRGSSTLVIGASLKTEAESHELPVRLQTAGVPETKSALSLLRQVANRRGLRHAGSPDLAEQVESVRVSPTAGGLYPVGPGDFSLLKVAAWAVASVERERRGAPSVW
jgi:hypothetical protein